jgi:hypothetical protein
MSTDDTGISPERWERVKEVFSAALERPRVERTEFVAGACGFDSVVQREVESLLDFGNSLGDFLSQPIVQLSGRTASPGRTLQPGELVGRYRVLSTLGVGGMGEVYLAEDPRLDRRVALKVVTGQRPSGAEQLRRFVLEARAASALSHPNIAAIYEIGLHAEGDPFIAMEYVSGLSLRERLRQGRLPVLDSLDIAVQVVAGLAAAHKAGIVHRDIKPENVMVREDGLVKLVDFGVAKCGIDLGAPSTSEAAGSFVTGSGILVGTLHYMSPEQARGIPVDVRSDVWAVGTLLYEMITGSSPFCGSSPTDVLIEILEGEPTRSQQLRAAAPAALAQVITKALQKDRNERYQSMIALAIDLREVQRAVSASQPESGQPDAAPVTADAPKGWSGGRLGRMPRRAWSVLALGVLGITLGAVLLNRWDKGPEGLFDHMLARQVAILEAREHSNRGRVFIETPVNHTGRPEFDSLAGKIAAGLGRLIADGRIAHVVPRDSVIAIEGRANQELGLNTPVQRLRRAEAFISVSTVYSLPRDSLRIFVRVQRRTTLSPRSEQLSERLANRPNTSALKGARASSSPREPLEIVETWRFGVVEAAIDAPDAAVLVLARKLARAFDGMRSCNPVQHRAVESLPWCWGSENAPRVVPGFWRSRTPEVAVAYEEGFRRRARTQ